MKIYIRVQSEIRIEIIRKFVYITHFYNDVSQKLKLKLWCVMTVREGGIVNSRLPVKNK